MKGPAWLMFVAVAVIVALIATLAVVSRAPVPVRQGTAPSVITDTTGAEAQPVAPRDPQQEPREAITSSNTGRAARGSGVEGVTSGGITIDPPSGR